MLFIRARVALSPQLIEPAMPHIQLKPIGCPPFPESFSIVRLILPLNDRGVERFRLPHDRVVLGALGNRSSVPLERVASHLFVSESTNNRASNRLRVLWITKQAVVSISYPLAYRLNVAGNWKAPTSHRLKQTVRRAVMQTWRN